MSIAHLASGDLVQSLTKPVGATRNQPYCGLSIAHLPSGDLVQSLTKSVGAMRSSLTVA